MPDAHDPDPTPAAPTGAPAAVRALVKARLLRATLGEHAAARPLLDGRYRLVREIGRGATGTVWEGVHDTLRRPVAIKLLRGSGAPDASARLLREAIAASSIGHEHIVDVIDFGVDAQDQAYLVMELLVGESLAAWLERHRSMPASEAIEVLLELADTLAAAHHAGIVHRDVKPANVFLVRGADGRRHCKLLDFGLCKPMASGSTDLTVTADGSVLGTPTYMAPEQIRGDEVDPRVDVYALGCVAYELVVGQPPFVGSKAAVFEAHLRAAVPRASQLPAALADAIDRALAKAPGDRFADMSGFAAALRAALRPREEATATVPAIPRPRRRALPWFGAAATLAIAASAGLRRPADAPTIEAPVPSIATIEPAAAPVTLPTASAPSAARGATPIAAVAVGPTPTVPQKPSRRRAAPRTKPPVEVAPAEPAEKPPAPALVDGIRDPFADR